VPAWVVIGSRWPGLLPHAAFLHRGV